MTSHSRRAFLQGSLSALALGALAADLLIVPVLTSQKGVDALPGLQRALNLYRRMHSDLHIGLYVPTMYESRRAHDREVLEALRPAHDTTRRPYGPAGEHKKRNGPDTMSTP